MKEDEMQTIAGWIVEAIKNSDKAEVLENIHAQVKELTAKFPLYTELRY